jgi:hypothetical protein
MRLFTFGDSWTEGVGGCVEEEYTTNIPEERTKIRHKYCWSKYLSDLLKIEFQNFGMGASSNKTIFDMVTQSIHNHTINKDDLVVIMWSSSLRDELPFFPSNNPWHFWGERYVSKKHIYEFIVDKSELNKSDLHTNLKKEYKEFFIENLFSNFYYNIVNQNYIIYLQFMFEKIGIRYLFCDAFDNMVKEDITAEIDKTSLINKTHYWGFPNKTMKDILIESNLKNVWEDGNLWLNNKGGKHPSKYGYELMANELYKWIIEKNILTYKTNKLNPNII